MWEKWVAFACQRVLGDRNMDKEETILIKTQRIWNGLVYKYIVCSNN
jgi:hypothetical protein